MGGLHINSAATTSVWHPPGSDGSDTTPKSAVD